MNSRIRPGERHANIVDYYCNSALVRRWWRLLRIFPLGSRRRRRIRRRRTVGHSYSVPNAQAVSGCISIGDESQAKPAGGSTLTRPTKSKLFYSCLLPILWLLAVVADHLQTRHDQMILRRGVAGRAAALKSFGIVPVTVTVCLTCGPSGTVSLRRSHGLPSSSVSA